MSTELSVESQSGKWTRAQFQEKKGRELIPMLTAYTYPVARALESAGIPILLVGDTLGMVEMGFASTRSVTMDHMMYHVGAVRRGAPRTHVIGDLPYLSDLDPETAVRNAKRLVEAGADSVKLEGPKYEVIRAIIESGIDVVGHTGLTPQTAENFKQVGRESGEANDIFAVATNLATAGCFMVVVEHVPADLGARIARGVAVPIIGIGAGGDCDGQVLVVNDLLGLGMRWPPFSKQYARMGEVLVASARAFKEEVQARKFPS